MFLMNKIVQIWGDCIKCMLIIKVVSDLSNYNLLIETHTNPLKIKWKIRPTKTIKTTGFCTRPSNTFFKICKPPGLVEPLIFNTTCKYLSKNKTIAGE